MRLEPIPEQALAEALERIAEDPDAYATCVLTDGTTMMGSAGRLRGSELELSSVFVQNPLSGGTSFNPHVNTFARIPVSEVSGIFDLPICRKQVNERSVVLIHHDNMSLAALAKMLNSTGSGNVVNIRFDPKSQDIVILDFFEWKHKPSAYDTPLYCDWSYFSNRKGGINSVGTAWASVGWEKSLMSYVAGVVDNNIHPLSAIFAVQEANVKCHCKFLKRARPDTGELEDSKVEMEGAVWIEAALLEELPSETRDMFSSGWAVGFFREDCFLVPRRTLEHIGKMRVFGDVVHVQAATDHGVVNGFLKARAAFRVKEDP